LKKLLVVCVIVLFLGLAIAPSINANVSKASIDSELVEITTEVCGLNGAKHTVKLTKEQAWEVEELFNSLRERLNATETREEADEMFKEAVVELDKYGLLGGLSVKQAQRLVTGGYQNQKVMNTFKRVIHENQYIINSNFLCHIVGKHENPGVMRYFVNRLLTRLEYLISFIENIVGKLKFSEWILGGITIVYILNFLPGIDLGKCLYFAQDYGNISTTGGKKQWNGLITGGFSKYIFTPALDCPLGVVGFTGFHVHIFYGDLIYSHSEFLGHALMVKLKVR